MSNIPKKYQHLLSPFKVGNHVFKNRMIATPGTPFLLQGPERYPNEAIFTHYVNKARSGAAMVTFGDIEPPLRERPQDDNNSLLQYRMEHPNDFNPDKAWYAISGRPYRFDIVNGACQNQLSQMVECIHFYNSKCIMMLRVQPPHGYDVSVGNAPDRTEEGSGGAMKWGKEITEEMLMKVVDEYELQSVLAKEIGFDGVFIHMGYHGPLTARLLSPLTNHRTDKFGGSIENRTRFALMVFDRIKERCGKDFLTLSIMSGWEPSGGYTLEDAVEFAKVFDGHLDMLQIKGPRNDLSHPSNFTLERTPFLHAAKTIKKAVKELIVVAEGGFQDLDLCEDTIASGKVDFVGISRAWVCNLDYGQLAYEGRNEDVVPCLRCNKCHVSSYYRPWTSFCSVNPVWGFEHRIDKMISPPQDKKKVAVIGGGPAGMEAALIASQRGHEVTLYEKTDSLGGLLKVYENVSFKWPHKDFKNYMIRKITDSRIKVCLNIEADAEMIQKEGYNAVISAIGAEATVPDISGVTNKNVIFAADVYGKENTLAKDVVVIGGGQAGVETGMHLAEKGHNVTVLEKAKMLARDAAPLQFYTMFREAWEKLLNFKGIVNACCNSITKAGITYIDADGKEISIKAGSVVIAVGMKPQIDLALKFHEAYSRWYMVGDCKATGDIQRAMRSAFAAASML